MTAPRSDGTTAAGRLRLRYSAISDVGRVRKENQDSGYAGPWMLTVCDGVGGAARGDIASSTAVTALRNLDTAPPPPTGNGAPRPADPADTAFPPSTGSPTDTPTRAIPTVGPEVVDDGSGAARLLDRLGTALQAAHSEIGRLVDDDPAINGTSTTATVALFDGRRVGVGHVGDSRAYLFRDGELSQLTTDHTLVQSLIDEGRISEEEARTHPHRNLILKALDGVHDVEPDLFVLELTAGDRLLVCSDGACGVLDDGRLADILATGSPDFASVELVRASLEAGSSDNVTCVVADALSDEAAEADPTFPDLQPTVVGAAAELKRRLPRGLFRGHRSGDTGELEPVDAELPDDVPFAIPTDPLPADAEATRYAPRPPERFTWLRRLLALLIVVGLVWIAVTVAWSWVQRQYYVGESDGRVVIFRGLDASLPGMELSEPVVETNVDVDDLAEFDVSELAEGIPADDLADARETVEELAGKRQGTQGDQGTEGGG